MFRSLCCFFILILALSFVSCSDDPTSTGLQLVNGNDKYNIIEVSTDTLKQSTSYFKSTADLSNGTRILLGKYGNTEASILVKFDLSSLADSIVTQAVDNNLNVTKAWIEFSPDYYIGNSNAPFDYNVNIVTNSWTTGFNTDSLSKLILGSEVSSARASDSFIIDNSSVLEWLKAESDSDAAVNNGIYMTSTSTGKIMGYYSSGAGDKRISPLLSMIIQKPGSYTDTLHFQALSKVHIVQGTLPAEVPGYMFVQGGVAIHSKWKFDISGIPNKSGINRALIDVYWDSTLSSRGVPPADSIVVMFDSAATSFDSSVTFILKREGNKFTGDIYYFIQQWVNNPETNHGLILSYSPSRHQKTTVDLLALYNNTAADVSKRPKVTIIYSTNLK